MIASDSWVTRSSSTLAFWASSRAFVMLFCRASSACSNGVHANFASSVSRTRKTRMVQMNRPGSTWTKGLFMANLPQARLLQQHDQQHEDFGENRHAFEQKQRQVDGAGDLGGGRWLARDPFGGGGSELANPEPRANHDHAEADSRAEVGQRLQGRQRG